MGMVKYFKRLFKYVLYEYKQPIIYANITTSENTLLHKDKIYFVTGGSSGIGFYIAKSLINNGAKVIISGRDEAKLKKACKSLGDFASYIMFDINNLERSKESIKQIYSQYGRIDGLINNAGISLHEKDFLDVSENNFDIQFSTNLKSAYFISQYYIDEVFKHNQQDGNIIFISSERGSMCDDLPYGLTKAALNSLTQGLSSRFYKKGIRVNAIAPGVTCSNLNNIDKNGDLCAPDKAAGRVLVPEEIAEVVNFILSDSSNCISGEIINCDAGNHISRYF